MSTEANQPAVVVGVDGSDTALGAAQWAAEFAIRHALPLTLLHAVPNLDWHFFSAVPPPEIDQHPDRDAVLAAAETAVRSTHPDLAIRRAVFKGAIAAALTDASQSARLVVVGTGAADHGVLGGHAVRIVNRTHCPVVVWRQPVAKRTGKPLPVVVGVDESKDSTRALAEAFDVAAALHAPLMVVHMWEIGAAVGLGYSQGYMDWQLLDLLQTHQRERMDEMIAPFAAKYRNAHVSKVFQDISPAKGLTDLSKEAQLVVVGSHGRGRLADSILGSVSQSLIHHAECPVLVVR